MKVVVDTSIILDFFDGVIENPYKIIQPYRILAVSPVVLHEVLRAYSSDVQVSIADHLMNELLPPPTLGNWIESASVMRELYPKREKQNVARMQNDVLIALSARDLQAPIWTRDGDFELICKHLGVGLLNK